MNIESRICAAVLLLVVLIPSVVSAWDDNNTLQANKLLATEAAREDGYDKLITQHARNGKAPDPKLFTHWILDEMNIDSAMRDQIGDELSEIQDNGHNSNWLTFYLTRNKQYLGRLLFTSADLTIQYTDGGKDGIYEYQVVLRAKDGFHGGVTIKLFKYTFKVKTVYSPFTKAYEVDVVSYPLYTGKTERETH